MTNQLLEAIKQGNTEQVRDLVAANPQLIQASDAAISPILLSIYMGKDDITAILLEYAEELTLHEAAASGQTKGVERIVEVTPHRIDEHGSDGFTPLGLAAYFGRTDVVRLLLGHGADLDLPSNNSQHVTPLQSAISSKESTIIDLLLARGVDVNVKQERGITPLMQAAHQGDAALVQRLLSCGADPAAQTREGRTALWYARDVNADDVVELLQSYLPDDAPTT